MHMLQKNSSNFLWNLLIRLINLKTSNYYLKVWETKNNIFLESCSKNLTLHFQGQKNKNLSVYELKQKLQFSQQLFCTKKAKIFWKLYNIIQ